MRRVAALMMLAALAASSACQRQSEGPLKVVVIGRSIEMPTSPTGDLSAPDAVLVQNIAQGLVRFDGGGNIVAGLAERWNVSDDGLSYIFRLAPTAWPNGSKVTADQVARLLKRGVRSGDVADRFGAIEDIVAMTDRVIEITLTAPRPDLLALLAQPDMAIMRSGGGTGPFQAKPAGKGTIELTREVVSSDDETTSRDRLILAAASSREAVRQFAAGDAAVVLGGTFADLPIAQRTKAAADALHFDPASGLFGLQPVSRDAPLEQAEVRQLLSQAIDRNAIVEAFHVPGLAARATLLEPGLDLVPQPVVPAWLSTPYAERLPALQAQASRLFGAKKVTVAVALPDGPGSDILFQILQRDWGALGVSVERAKRRADADFVFVDEVAPSSSPSWFVRRFRCGTAPLCEENADQLMESARQATVPAQRSALLAQAAAIIDNAQLFIPIAAPIRWSLVSTRVGNFTGNRYARHTLTALEAKSASGD